MPDTEYVFEVTGDVTEGGRTFTSPTGKNSGVTGHENLYFV